MVAQFCQPMEKRAYSDKLKDGRWIRRRDQVFRAADYRCEECGTPHDLQCHHVFYRTGKDPWEYPDALLMCLCSECHLKRQEVEQNILVNVATVLREKTLAELRWQPIYAFFEEP